MVKKYEIRFTKDFEECKKGNIATLTYKKAERYINLKVAEYTESTNAFSQFSIVAQVSNFNQYQPFFYDSVNMFHLWNEEECKWEMCDEVDMLNNLSSRVSTADTITSKTKTEIITALKQVGRKNRPKEMPKTWIQFKDKIVDVENGKEYKASPEYYTTNPIPWKLGKSNETPMIDKLIREWVVDNKNQNETFVKTMKQIIAYIASSDQFLQRIIALCGAGMNGKGTYIQLVSKFIGKNNYCSSDIKTLSTNNFETSALYKKLCCMIGEVDASDLRNTNTIKKLSGEDEMRYEFKGKGSFTETSPTTCLIATNSLPNTPDKSLGFYRRWLIIDFPHQFAVKRNLLGNIPNVEFENLGRCVLEYLKEMYETNEFENEGEINKREERYEERSNPLMKFIESDYEEDLDLKIPIKKFCKEFNDYLKIKHLRVVAVTKVGKMLRDEGFEIASRDGAKCIIGINKKTTQTTQNSIHSSCNHLIEKVVVPVVSVVSDKDSLVKEEKNEEISVEDAKLLEDFE